MIQAGTITRIEIQKGNKNRFSIFLDGQFAFGVDASVLIKFDLKKGLVLSEETVEQVVGYEEKHIVLEKAYSLLARRDHSRKELTDKLNRRGYSNELVIRVIDEIQQAGFLDDAIFARRYANTRLQIRPMGRKLLFFELLRKGITNELAEKTVAEAYDGIDEFALARQLAAKRISSYRKGEESKTKQKQKLSAYLRQRGFEWEIVTQIVNENIS